MYLYSVLPSMLFAMAHIGTRTYIAADLSAEFATLPSHKLNSPFPRSLRISTLELASNNLVCSVALTGVLALQAGRWWAERADSDDDEQEAEIVAEKETNHPKRRPKKDGAAGTEEKSPRKLRKRRAEL
jgi:hypothetical protein